MLAMVTAIACISAQQANAQQFQTPVLPGETATIATQNALRSQNRLLNTTLLTNQSQAPSALDASTASPRPATASSIPATDLPSGKTSTTQADSKQISYNTFAPPVHIQPSSTNTPKVEYRNFSDQVEQAAANRIATSPRRPAVDSIYNSPIQSLKNSVNTGNRTPQRMLMAKSVPTPDASRSGMPRRRPRVTPSQKPERENAIAKLQNQFTKFLYTPAVPSQRFNNDPSAKSRSRYSQRPTRSNVSPASRRTPSSTTALPQRPLVSSTQQRNRTEQAVQYAYSNESTLDSSESVQNAVQQVVLVEPSQDPFNDETVELPPSERNTPIQSLTNFEQDFEPSIALQPPSVSEPKADPSTMSQISVLNKAFNPDSATSPKLIGTQEDQDLGRFKKPIQDPTLEDLPFPNSDFEFGTNQRPTISSFRNCDDFRAELLDGSIKDIALDLSPLPGRNRRLYVTESRDWIDRDGDIVATGTMIDLRRGYVIIESALGTEKIPYAKLSDADWATISQFWQIPELCSAGNQGTAARNWAPQTYAWQASALCHKPLYFENVQLERYGHTYGPIRQPIHSVAHFFVSLVTVPYQSGIHPVSECQYALGFYRPGDCAPWLKDPVPFSLNGAVRQALVTTGVAVIP